MKTINSKNYRKFLCFFCKSICYYNIIGAQTIT